MQQSEYYKDKQGYWAFRKNGRNHRFCAVCGLHLKNAVNRLEDHFRGQHPGLEEEFLKFGEKPPECMYSNWDQWLLHPSLPLIEDLEKRKLLKGRPRKVQKLLEEPNDVVRDSEQHTLDLQNGNK